MRDRKKYFYDSFAADFDRCMNKYDLQRRLFIIFDDLLPAPLEGMSVLDAGCGTGWFSAEAQRRGAVVVAIDMGVELLKQAAQKSSLSLVAADALALPFADNSFDICISTEVIEHTTNPEQAVYELGRVVKPGGIIVLTTPNKVWFFAVWLANVLHMRPYGGYEHWVGWRHLRRWFEAAGCTVEEMYGFHMFPFFFPFLNPLLRWLDRFGRTMGPGILNICVKARKKSEEYA